MPTSSSASNSLRCASTSSPKVAKTTCVLYCGDFCCLARSHHAAQGMHTVDAIRALHASLPAAVGSDPVVAADSAKDQWVAAIEAFAATIPCALAPPQSPSFASQQAPLKPLAGAYPHMPSAQEVQQFESYYLKVAADNAVEAERERNAACACTGLRSWLPTGWRASR